MSIFSSSSSPLFLQSVSQYLKHILTKVLEDWHLNLMDIVLIHCLGIAWCLGRYKVDDAPEEAYFSGCPREFYHRIMYIALSCDHSLLTLILPFEAILRKFSGVWSENGALFKRLMKIHWNPPILYYGSKSTTNCWYHSLAGIRCDQCDNNYYGNPTESGGACQLCSCNGNTLISNPGNCDARTGRCLRCLYDTAGYNCDVCAPGFYGDAIQRTCRSKL